MTHGQRENQNRHGLAPIARQTVMFIVSGYGYRATTTFSSASTTIVRGASVTVSEEYSRWNGFVTTPLLEAHDLDKTFPPLTRRDQPAAVLHGITMAVMPGEMVSIVGPSGSGKSTLLYCLSGLESPTSGAISVMGHDLSTMTRSQLTTLRSDHIGFVFQAFNLIPSLSARQNVALPARLARRGLDDQRIDRALADVGLSGHARKRPGELSGGQQQRVAIARVLASQPDIVFADEPTGSLDTANGAEVLRLLRRATTPTSALVMVTHDLEAAALADRVLVMRDGTIHRELLSPTADAVLDAVRGARTVVEE